MNDVRASIANIENGAEWMKFLVEKEMCDVGLNLLFSWVEIAHTKRLRNEKNKQEQNKLHRRQ